MFGKKSEKRYVIKKCKYCFSDDLNKMETSSGFGGGQIHSVHGLGGVYYCLKCGRITDASQFTTKVIDEDEK